MCATGDSAGVTHCIQKFLLIRARVFAREFDFDIDGTTIRDPVTPDIGFAMLTHTNDTTVLCIELTDSVVDCVAAVLTEGHDNLVL